MQLDHMLYIDHFFPGPEGGNVNLVPLFSAHKKKLLW